MRVAPLLLSSLLLAGCGSGANEEAQNARAAAMPRAVSAGKIERRAIAQDLLVSGVLVAREEAAVSSQLSGFAVAHVYVDQDDQVRAGQPLAVLDDSLLRADIEQQRAVVAQQRIAAEKARSEAARVSGLENAGVLSSEAITERRLGARTAGATLAQAQAALKALLVRQGFMTIRAPVSGRILSRAVRPGDIAAPGTIMFRIARDNLVELDAEVPEQSINLVRPGQPATLTLPSGLTLPGTVRLVSAEIDPQTKLGRARILMGPDRALRPGGFAEAHLTVAEAEVPAVRQSAIRHESGTASVMILDSDNRVRSRPVHTGASSGGWIAVIDGPAIGTRVLIGGQGFVLDGDKVAPRMVP
ncbi:efflux RND transporter periplasmic adaptor subunit [Sphingomonas tabacisoli]|uniref:Efflux RND transporter periplasmic adaptor subunit n=1 Tax=Sphingomonas tabacisoli TaxID=2249466 RepID=A0ABW4I302_9SPHN